jgi:hypothetical protein
LEDGVLSRQSIRMALTKRRPPFCEANVRLDV